MNKQELASKIWAGANELRGKVSASNYKDYMLGLIFYKFLSSKEEKYLKESLYFEDVDFESWIEKSKDENFESKLSDEDNKTIENCRDNIGYFIYPHNLFSYWIKNGVDFKIADVRQALSAFNRLIGKNYKKVYSGVFNALEKGLDTLGTSDADRSKAVRKLINLINDIPVDTKQEYDVLGFVYEFLLKNFAANAGKAGEFYTPFECAEIMSEIISNHLKDRSNIKIYDPTSGSGSLLINIGKSISKYLDNPNSIQYYAQELVPETYNLTRMNLMMRGILPDNIIVRNGDTLLDDWPFFDDNDKERTYDPVFVDACSSNPPYSSTWNPDEATNDLRFTGYGLAPKSKADYAFLLHNLYHLKPDGIMTIVLPHGTLFRGKCGDGSEGTIRQALIDKNNIETIIGLPANCFFGTGIPTIIMVIKKNRTESDVLFVDASKGFMKDGNKNKLRAKDVRKIVDTVINRKTIDKFSRLVSKEEIIANEYNLNISRYIDSSVKENVHDIYSLMYGGIPNYEIDELEEYWKAFPSLRKQLFIEQEIPYSHVTESNIDEIIENNSDIKSFREKFNSTFSNLPNYLINELIDKSLTLRINKEEVLLASKIEELLKGIPLIDYYDAYQLLDNDWTRIALDLEYIQIEGMDALKVVDPNMIAKKDSKTKEITEVQKGWKGHILPFELIQEEYFKNDKNKLDALKEKLSNLEEEKERLLESIEPADKEELLKQDGEDIDSTKLKVVISKLKKELKQGAIFDEDSYEDIIIKVNDVNSEMSKLKKDIKKAEEKLVNDTKTKIENLTADEAIKMLEAKWVTPLCNSLSNLTNQVVESLIEKVELLKGKYLTTLNETTTKIKENSESLSSMIDELSGPDFDMKGLKELKKLLGGEDNE